MLDGLLQPTHLILILLVIFLVFGAGKLPEVGGALGKSIREFKGSITGDDSESKPQQAQQHQITSGRYENDHGTPIREDVKEQTSEAVKEFKENVSDKPKEPVN